MEIHAKFITVWLVAAVAGSGSLVAQSDTRREIQLHYERAQTAMRANQLDRAANEFRQILRLDAKSASAYANLGMIAFKQGNYAQAVESFGAAVNLNPSLWDAQAFLGLSHARLGHGREARPFLEQSLQHIQNRSLRTEVGVDLIKLAQESNTLDREV